MKLVRTIDGISYYRIPAEFSADNKTKVVYCWQSLLEYFVDKRPSCSKGVQYEYLFADMFQHYSSECNVNQWAACDIGTFRRCMERLDYDIEYSEDREAEVTYVEMPYLSDDYYFDGEE